MKKNNEALTLIEALEKEYEVKGVKNGQGTFHGSIYVPKILIGKKVMLKLVIK